MAEDEDKVPTGTAAASPISPADLAAAEATNRLSSLNISNAQDNVPRSPPDAAKKEDPEMWESQPPTKDCPVCLVPLPLANDQATYWPCCGMRVCNACEAETVRALYITNRKRKDKKLPPIGPTCAFCRQAEFSTDSEVIKMYEERVDKGDLEAMVVLALKHRTGENGLARDEAKALELLHRAADLGSQDALGKLGQCFFNGELGVIEDKKKGMAYLEDATKKGNVFCRFNIGVLEEENQQHGLAMRHYKLAAAAGEENSMKRLRKYFSLGKFSEAELEETLRAHKEKCDEMNSEERERYEACKEAMAGNDDTLKLIYKAYYIGLMTPKALNFWANVY